MLARTMPVVLALLADGIPRSKRAIVAALADRHDQGQVGHAVMRLAVTGRIVERQRPVHLAQQAADVPPGPGGHPVVTRNARSNGPQELNR